MQATELSLKEASAAIGVAESTLKRWLAAIPVEGTRKDSQGGWRFSPEAIAALERVKQLRERDDRGLESIRIIIGPSAQASGDRSPSEPRPVADHTNIDMLADVSNERADSERRPFTDQVDAGELAALVVDQVVEALKRENADSEKYARAAHHVGKLEAQLEAERAERLRLFDRTRELEGIADHARELEEQVQRLSDAAAADTAVRVCLQAERERLADELERGRSERERLMSELERAHRALAERSPTGPVRPWWRIWG